MSPDHMSPDDMSPDHMSPDHMSPDHMSPDDMSPDHMSAGIQMSHQSRTCVCFSEDVRSDNPRLGPRALVQDT